MSRRLCFALAVMICVAGSLPAYCQDAQPSSSATDASAPSGDSMANLKKENTALKKEVSDAAKTIAELQSKLTDTSAKLDAANSELADTKTQLAAAKAQPASAPVAADANAPAPAGPLKALPIDAPNPALEGTNAAAGTAPAVDTANARSYTVVKGDSLWKIAHKMYPGDTKNGVDKIQEANKDAIGGKPLKIGQVLVIP